MRIANTSRNHGCSGRGAAASAVQPRCPRAFTLIETSLAIVIVGIGVTAIISAQQAFHQQNRYAQRVGQALLLANEVREMTMGMPRYDPITADETWGPEQNEPTLMHFDDLDDFDGDLGGGLVISPPIDATRSVIPDMKGWSQSVTVQNIQEDRIDGNPVPDHSTDLVRITCRVLFQGPGDSRPTEVTRLTWVRADER